MHLNNLKKRVVGGVLLLNELKKTDQKWSMNQ